jgi:hypothetical protein
MAFGVAVDLDLDEPPLRPGSPFRWVEDFVADQAKVARLKAEIYDLVASAVIAARAVVVFLRGRRPSGRSPHSRRVRGAVRSRRRGPPRPGDDDPDDDVDDGRRRREGAA